MIRLLIAALLVAGLAAGCGGPRQGDDSLDSIARDYLLLSLTIGEKEEGYIDAYYGPPELQQRARADAPAASLDSLARRTDALRARVARFEQAGGDGLEQRRAKFLAAQLTAAATRLKMMQGEKLAFQEEAQGLFGVRPEIMPLSSFDPALARIEGLVPGDGPLWQRVDSFQDRFTIPADRLKPVFDAAIAECRRRTADHIPLPPGESFTMEFVTGKSWSGYNYYQGDYRSLIQINTDLPIRISRAVDLGCHEGYPGHHLLNSLLEQRFARQRGWIEYSVYPLYSPQSLIAEGTANYGIDLAFPGEDRLRYETQVLYPLAGLPTDQAGTYLSLLKAMKALRGARFTIARDYLDGRIDRERAIALTQKYQLVSRERAQQSVDFIDDYRSYVINYGLGEDMAEAYIQAAGDTPGERWAAMEKLLSEPTLPSDLRTGR